VEVLEVYFPAHFQVDFEDNGVMDALTVGHKKVKDFAVKRRQK